jgi:diphosphomevalonate decarboxylase
MIQTTMPSNIALIKYMGKNAMQGPINSSLSWTLPHLSSKMRFEPHDQDRLITSVTLKPGGEEKFLQHFQRLKMALNITQCFHIHSENNFPSGAGLASSASAYAALTQGTYLLSQSLKTHAPLSIDTIANLSAKGSGSSIRSFYGPYCIWSQEGARATGENWPKLESCVAIIDDQHKKISSSEAHQRVMTCPNINQRAEKANERLAQLIKAFDQTDWDAIYQICKDEFLDMHHLFHTCQTPFKYINTKSEQLIQQADKLQKQGTPLIITMDAGANVHFLYPVESVTRIKTLATEYSQFPWRFSHV